MPRVVVVEPCRPIRHLARNRVLGLVDAVVGVDVGRSRSRCRCRVVVGVWWWSSSGLSSVAVVVVVVGVVVALGWLRRVGHEFAGCRELALDVEWLAFVDDEERSRSRLRSAGPQRQ